VFLSSAAPRDATLWAILSWGSSPLHGAARRLRHRPLDRRHLSWGSGPLQRSRWRESTSPPVSRWAARFDPGVRRRVPPPRLRCRAQVFSTSQRLLPLSAAPPFSDGWRSWGSPFRGLILARSPGDSSSPAYPLDVAPAGCASPVLGGGIRGRDRRCLGDANGHLSRLQGLSSSCESVCVTSDFHPVVTDLPLLGFCLLMVYTSAGGRGSPL
jgi:hypothetical protein